jgi:aspartate aminotransferase-like enzyme
MARAETLRDRGLYFSVPHLFRAAERHLPLTTPALPVYHALACQLDRIEEAGGLETRFARHALMAQRMVEWTDTHPEIALLAVEGQRSPTVSALELPSHLSPSDVVQKLEAEEYLIASGLPPLTDRLIRIGHMGDLELPHLDELLAALQRVLRL